MKALISLAIVGFSGLLAVPEATAQGASAQPAPAHPETTAYGLVVGSNDGGPGQDTLHYAEDDALRVAEVLTTLGGYDATRVERLLRPSAGKLMATLDRLETRLAEHARAGERSLLFFYYSGHARADALNLGHEKIALSMLRERLMRLPATLAIVVLDACQSGAFSRIKGAQPAADFSFNSVQRLNTEGVVVMASSSGKELSQESEELRGGYFTHHLLVSLRGAGDEDGDGRVTLSEAYRYAYNRTLASTAATAVGEQHVTLETELSGKGDLALTYPGERGARMRLDAPFVGRMLLQKLPSFAVLAEVDKTRGKPLDLSLPDGEYVATVRVEGRARRCTITLADGKLTILEPGRCPEVTAAAQSKGPVDRGDGGDGGGGRQGDEGWLLELAVGAGTAERSDDYQESLGDFGFAPEQPSALRLSAAAGRRLLDHLAVGVSFFNLDSAHYRRDEEPAQNFEWSTLAFGAFAQGDLSIGPERFAIVFARGGAGLTHAATRFDEIVDEGSPFDGVASASFQDITPPRTEKTSEAFVGYYLAGSLGVSVMPTTFAGMFVEVRYVYAPALDNLLGQTHDSGGMAYMLGLRLRSWE